MQFKAWSHHWNMLIEKVYEFLSLEEMILEAYLNSFFKINLRFYFHDNCCSEPRDFGFSVLTQNSLSLMVIYRQPLFFQKCVLCNNVLCDAPWGMACGQAGLGNLHVLEIHNNSDWISKTLCWVEEVTHDSIYMTI